MICTRLTDEQARVAELVDALGSGSSVLTDVEVQVLSRADKKSDPIGVALFVWGPVEDLNRVSAER